MMITAVPKISVLVPVYNAEMFICDTINAVLNQTFQNFELILLNDASTDKTAECIAKYQDPRIVYLENKQNLGITASRNKLITAARGEYIAVLDHDDICLPQRLETQLDFFYKHPEISMAGSWFELFCPPSAPWFKRFIINAGWVWCHPQRPTLTDARKGNVLMHPTIMYRRKDFEQHHIRYSSEMSPAEDYHLVYQALKKGLRLANIPQILLKYRLYGGNCSIKRKKQMKLADKKIKRLIYADLNIPFRFLYPYWLVILQKLRLKFML